MKTIYKYTLNVLDCSIIRGRIDKFLSVDYQRSSERVCVWAVVDDAIEESSFIISSYGTGHKLPNDTGNYIGTVQLYSGEVVLHFFYKQLCIENNKEIKEFDGIEE